MSQIRSELSKKNKSYIKKNRYFELKYFCLQYDDYKYMFNVILNTMRAYDFTKVQHSIEASSTELKTEACVKYANKIEIIERAAREACPELYSWLLKAVTRGLSYTTLVKQGLPCSKNMYYKYYRKFFKILDSWYDRYFDSLVCPVPKEVFQMSDRSDRKQC